MNKRKGRWTSATARLRRGRYTHANAWDAACQQRLQRRDGTRFGKPEVIDPGVNFFVLVLEQMGIRTHFSCEGHPDGFYITFGASYAQATKIKMAGFFSVEIEGARTWSLRIHPVKDEDERGHVDCLRWAADAWEKRFGKLKLPKRGAS